VRALIELPVAVTGEYEIEDYHSLAVRDLQRGQGVGLPSGEAVARHIGIAPLTAVQVGIASTGWQGETPLWYYILREADACRRSSSWSRWWPDCDGGIGGNHRCGRDVVSSRPSGMATSKNS
jgi:hypothetical protein